MTTFKAFWVEKNDKLVKHSIIERSIDDLPAGEVLIKVAFSSLNFKDALSAKGMPGVTREYPHTPGIDASGTVVSSESGDFSAGDEVIVTGYDLGMNTAGGFGQYIRVPAGWVIPMPNGLSLEESMILGTAGLTAGLCVEKLTRMGAAPEDGPVLVTGATGGVGSIAIMLLSKLGYEVVAMSGKAEQKNFLESLGASRIIGREELGEANPRPMLATAWAHAVDTVGGEILSNIIKGLKEGGSVAICGLVASPKFDVTVLPFILRGVNVLGIDSVEIPREMKSRVWQLFATTWKLEKLNLVRKETGLEGLSEAVDRIFAGQMVGRTLLNLDK